MKPIRNDSLSAEKSKFFYGYWILVIAFLCAFIHSGCGFYAFSLFVKPLEAEFGWGRGEIMIGLTIFFLTSGLSAPAVGRLVDRYGSKKVIVIGSLVTGLGFVLVSLVHSLWFFYVSYVVVGLGMAGTGMVPATAVISNWFEKWRGTAVGIMSTGIGAGGLVMAPFIGYLRPNFGWRAAFVAMALITWALIPFAIWVLKTKPSDLGLYPDGQQGPEMEVETVAAPSASEGLTLKMALTTPTFWLIAISFLANGFSEVGVLQTQVPYLEDIGFPLATATMAFGFVGLFSSIGKFLFGVICDRIQAKYACTIGLIVQLAGISILMTVRPESHMALLWLYTVVIGLGVGSWLPAMSMLVSTNFGLVAYGSIFGMISFTQAIGAATGPLMGGFIYDATGTYRWAFIVYIILYAIAIPTVLAARRPRSL
jgi:MFS family permease